ncbi:NH(3)-dependent NAD(+) synthetase [Marinitoga hydrogenitolerans DSM 16785]|uniref:NH(3)-dependent NAD(+) synthetase n=1 Tax=Marinitoga hydrogenitolerans (strain DSM 16785 / JCM 12826 / AT1271) TaxID=1122195 RepID=A0A1M4UJP7_MARH1|nr:NAD(+) synthase [Marinitoga hydrogenitolerans]SHE56884.1 NH(3)-dependent NAD(+) synthetase [Marinitoga hydrogenitolerans DSM 16785]
MIEKIKNFIKDNIDKYEYNGAMIGISGGIDSAVVGKLCVDTLGKERVKGLILPERDSSPETLNDAKLVCEFLNIEYKIVNISPILRKMGVYRLEPPTFFIPRKIQENYVKKEFEKRRYINDLMNKGDEKFLKGLAYYRSKHRVRMILLYFYAEQLNYAVIGTTNKSELKTGFYVKYGDDSVDIEPIMHLYKTQVFEIAKELRIPEKIIYKSPSPDLVPGITDEYAMGISYADLDRILIKLENKEDLSDENDEMVKKVKKILDAAKYREIKNLHLR